MNVPDLKRISYFDGQRLTATDLSDASDFTQQLRWLHNRGLHGWGIASGLQVTGAIGARSVTVAPGYAVDSMGREVILAAKATANVPAVSAHGAETMYYLVASWISDADETVLETSQGPCSASGAVRLSDDPLIAWRSQQDLQNGLDIVLGQVWVRNCRLSRAVSSAGRRNARPSQQPYVAGGQADAVFLNWTPIPGGPAPVGLQAEIDTSTGQFGSTPQYFVQLDGERYLASSPGGPLLAVPFAVAANARSDGFTLQVLLPPGPGIVNNSVILDPAHTADILKGLAWHVAWIGVEG
jgi:hypothetical protein